MPADVVNDFAHGGFVGCRARSHDAESAGFSARCEEIHTNDTGSWLVDLEQLGMVAGEMLA